MITFNKSLYRIPYKSVITIRNMSYEFGPYKLSPGQVFFESDHSIGIVNLKPIVPGHVLFVSKRNVPRLADLSKDEVQDLYSAVHTAVPILEKQYDACACNIAMQDGLHSGQSVPHVHIHVLPRIPGDFERNDDIYPEIENQNLNEVYRQTTESDGVISGSESVTASSKSPFDNRVPRTEENMAVEAAKLRQLFPDNQPKI